MWTVKARMNAGGLEHDAFPNNVFGKFSEARAALEKFLGLPPGDGRVYDNHWFQSDGWFDGVEIGAAEYAKKHGWTREDWNGNPALGFSCWGKKFAWGYISVGCGKFASIVHSFGANSGDSYCSTRILMKEDRIMSEAEAMKQEDTQWGKDHRLCNRTTPA